MATWIWIVIAVGAAIVLLALLFGARRGREKRLVQRREKAQELRQEAQRREQRAEEHSQQAREERRHAEAVGSRADQIDPDRD